MLSAVALVVQAAQCAPMLRGTFTCDEIVHIYAPHQNRFLAEGLAVYLHAKLAGNPAFPNFGEDLRRLAARDLPGAESLNALNAVRTPRPLGTVLDERTAYGKPFAALEREWRSSLSE